MVEPKEFFKPKQLLDEAWDETIKYSGKLIRMTKSRQDHIRTQLIHLLEKKKPTKFEIDLAQIWLKAYDKTQKFTKKALADSVKRLDYLTVLYKQEAEASKIRMAKNLQLKRKHQPTLYHSGSSLKIQLTYFKRKEKAPEQSQ